MMWKNVSRGVIFRDAEPVGRETDNLLTFDRKAIVAAERPDIVVVMLTNADDYQTLECSPEGETRVGNQIIRAEK
ncbi:MAG: hypothetical protein IJQ81_16745 [Oscillibacter sp.]|nr:hypothetical protein [Oscillibacter sp.]